MMNFPHFLDSDEQYKAQGSKLILEGEYVFIDDFFIVRKQSNMINI